MVNTKIDSIICTSVEEAKSSIKFVLDIDCLYACLSAEKNGMNRVSMINNINIRINQLKKNQEIVNEK